MVRCWKCGNYINGIPLKCHYCGKLFCSSCISSNSHQCERFYPNTRQTRGTDFRASLYRSKSSAKSTTTSSPQRKTYTTNAPRKKSHVLSWIFIIGAVIFILFILYGPAFGVNNGQLEQQIHNLINQNRQANGLKPLSFDPQLAAIARAHSQDMATNNYFSHNSLNGADPTTRASSAGYPTQKSLSSYSYTTGIGENIFQNNLYSSVTYVELIPFFNWNSQNQIAESTVQGWMNSPGHRQNILTPTYDREGIGVAVSSNNKVYITEDFY